MKWKQRHLFVVIITAGMLFVLYEAVHQQRHVISISLPPRTSITCIRDGTCGGDRVVSGEDVLFSRSDDGETVTGNRWTPPGWPPPIVGDCPKRYLTVNTHTWGRHHNQLQSVMNALITAHLLNRTFVLGHFRHAKHWYSVSDFYDFSEISYHYCVIDHDQMVATSRQKPLASVACHGQNINDLPIGKALGLKCPGKSESFPNYDFKAVVAQKLDRLRSDTSTLINLSGQLAFYLRPGLKHISQVYALLKPAPEIKKEIARFQQSMFSHSDYVSIHLRYREGTCIEELNTDFVKAFNISNELLAGLQEQCKINYVYSKRVLEESIDYSSNDPNSFSTPVFLASDHQNASAEKDLTSRGAVLYEGAFTTKEIGGLKGLATDYFLMRGGRVFIGNTASSVSQNTCYGRLLTIPWSRACAGWNFDLLSTMTTTALGS